MRAPVLPATLALVLSLACWRATGRPAHFAAGRWRGLDRAFGAPIEGGWSLFGGPSSTRPCRPRNRWPKPCPMKPACSPRSSNAEQYSLRWSAAAVSPLPPRRGVGSGDLLPNVPLFPAVVHGGGVRPASTSPAFRRKTARTSWIQPRRGLSLCVLRHRAGPPRRRRRGLQLVLPHARRPLDDVGRGPRCGPHRSTRRPVHRLGVLPGLWRRHPRPRLVMDAFPHTLTVPRTARWWSATRPTGSRGAGLRPPQLWPVARVLHPEVPGAGQRRLARGGAGRCAPLLPEGNRWPCGGQLDTREARLDDIADQTRFLDALRAELDAESDAGSGAGLRAPRLLAGRLHGAAVELPSARQCGQLGWTHRPQRRDPARPEGVGRPLRWASPRRGGRHGRPPSRTPHRASDGGGGMGGGRRDPDRIRFHTFLGVHDVDAATVSRVLDAIG